MSASNSSNTHRSIVPCSSIRVQPSLMEAQLGKATSGRAINLPSEQWASCGREKPLSPKKVGTNCVQSAVSASSQGTQLGPKVLADLYKHCPPDLSKETPLKKAVNVLLDVVLGTPAPHAMLVFKDMPDDIKDIGVSLIMRSWKPISVEFGRQPFSSLAFHTACNAFQSNSVLPGRHGPMFTWTATYEGLRTLEGKQKLPQKTRTIVEGVDARTGLYPEGEWSGRTWCLMNTAARVSLFPYILPLKLRETHSKYGSKFSVAAILRMLFLHMDGANSLGVARPFNLTAEMQESYTKANFATSKPGALSATASLVREVRKALENTPRTRVLALKDIQTAFGYVPKVFSHILEDDLIRLFASMVSKVLVSADSGKLLPATTTCKVLALSAYSYNCYYLTAVYVTLAAKLSPGVNGLTAVVRSMRRPIQRIKLHHDYISRLRDQPGAFQRFGSEFPSASVSLPGDKSSQEEVLLHLAAELTQPQPLWPPGMLKLLKQRCHLSQVEQVRTLVLFLGSLRMIENNFPVLQEEPWLQSTLQELYVAGIFLQPVSYHPTFVVKRHWEQFYQLEEMFLKSRGLGSRLCCS